MPPTPAIEGSILAYNLFDVGEEIKLDVLRERFGGQTQRQAAKSAAPAYVRFERPPVIQELDPLKVDGGSIAKVQVKFYDYGAVSVLQEVPFRGSWEELAELSSRLLFASEYEQRARQIVAERIAFASDAIVKLNAEWLTEDYFIFHLQQVDGNPPAADLLRECGDMLACIVRGEAQKLSPSERDEVLQSSISYYPNDLAVIGWNAAVVYDTPPGAETALQLLEYANSQLLEFRYYDEMLTKLLSQVQSSVGRRGLGLWDRWGMARRANFLRSVLVETTELTERVDNAIKFLSDMFSARLYELAADKVGVTDYKKLVNKKLRMADELYRHMLDQYHESRGFALELLVIVILILELIAAFRPY